MMLDDQGETIAFLSDPASYGDSAPVERIETHISIIFLTGDRAYKLKKALKLPYVDFSTIRLREAACRAELALNGETAPGLYLGVRTITRATDGRLQWADDESGDVERPLVDAVVEMVRFGQDQLLDRIAGAGELTPALMTETARMIAGFHAKAPAVSSDGGGAANIAAVLEINEAGFATSQVFAREQVRELAEQFRAGLARHAPLLDARARAGKIRRCHGDLHLRNICLLEGQPRLFDCIEFNPQIATIDVLYDLAFLLMDLWHLGLAELANLTLNRYLDASNEDDGIALMPFFMAVRAAVRAHVTATQAEEPHQDYARLGAEAKSYFDLARMLLKDEEPRLIAIGGFSGSGKSTVADHLACRIGSPPGARVIESDRLRKALHGVTAETHLPDAAYRPEVSAKVYAEMAERAAEILRQGGSVVADAVFDDPARRDMIERTADGLASFRGIWLDADPALLHHRVEARRGGASDADVTVLAQQLAGRGKEDARQQVAWQHLDASLPLDTLVASIVRLSEG
jgi:aminoglycoside phosphotransferase family enzyme/predicted kinase